MQEAGFTTVPFHKKADVYIINTCSVTDNADKKCRKVIRQALKHSPTAYIVIVGCYAQLKPTAIANIEGVDLVLGAAEKFNIAAHLRDLTKREKGHFVASEIKEVNQFVHAYSVGERTRSFLKVQDGCDYKCAFCTIPLARGKSRSDRLENVVRNAHEIARLGVKEIVLTGVNIGDYGKGLSENVQFLDLIRALDAVPIERFRISSIEPNLLNEEIIRFVAQSKRFMPHFHIPLQSGSNKILRLMRRRYQRELYAERVEMIRQQMPNASIGVDVIVGFPGETETEFLETYHFLNELDVSYLHVFTYSERANTKALDIRPTIPMDVRRKRSKMLRILSEKKRRAFYTKHLGSTRKVLFEAENEEGMMYGFTDNYVKIKTVYEPLLINESRLMELVDFTEDGLVEVRECLREVYR